MRQRIILTAKVLLAAGAMLALPTDQTVGQDNQAARSPVAITPAEVRAIAKDAYIFAYPIVMNYRTMYMQAIKGERAFGKWLHLGLSSPADKDTLMTCSDTHSVRRTRG